MELAVIALGVVALIAVVVLGVIVQLVVGEQRRRDLAHDAQTNMLLERIQRPEVPIVADLPVDGPDKLWKSEEDEIDAALQHQLKVITDEFGV